MTPEKRNFTQIANLFFDGGYPTLSIYDKWAALNLIQHCWKDEPYELSLRAIEAITEVPYSILCTVRRKGKEDTPGVLDRLQETGILSFYQDRPIDKVTGKPGRLQTFIHIHHEKIWQANDAFYAKTVCDTNDSVCITNSDVRHTNNSVCDTNVTVCNVSVNAASNIGNTSQDKKETFNTPLSLNGHAKEFTSFSLESSSQQESVVPPEESTQPPLLDTPLTEPSMSGTWNAETIVQYAEYKNNRRYSPKARETQLAAAKKLHAKDKTLTLEQFKAAYDRRFDAWWLEHCKKLDVSDMASKDSKSVIRLYAMLEDIEQDKVKANVQVKPTSNGNKPAPKPDYHEAASQHNITPEQITLSLQGHGDVVPDTHKGRMGIEDCPPGMEPKDWFDRTYGFFHRQRYYDKIKSQQGGV